MGRWAVRGGGWWVVGGWFLVGIVASEELRVRKKTLKTSHANLCGEKNTTDRVDQKNVQF